MARSVGVITKTQADRCGNAVRRWYRSEVELSEDELEPPVNAISDWRQTHAHPLSLVTPGVRNWVSREASGDIIVGQRLKRLDRIVDKLARFPTMRLSQMEDVGGCRAVLATPTEVEAVTARALGRDRVSQRVSARCCLPRSYSPGAPAMRGRDSRCRA
jgi:hypothetical protein